MDGQRIGGTWRVAQSTDPGILEGVSVRFVIVPDGLRIEVRGAEAYEVAWADASVSTTTSGRAVVATGRGKLWLDPEVGANAALFERIFAGQAVEVGGTSPYEEFPAGEGQVLVLYRGLDDGNEVDPAPLLSDVADDAAIRAAAGWRLVSMVGMPLRHGGQVIGLQGGGFTTKQAIGCLYVRDAAASA